MFMHILYPLVDADLQIKGVKGFIKFVVFRNTRDIWKVCSMVFYLGNRLTKLFMFGIILNSFLSSMLGHKFTRMF